MVKVRTEDGIERNIILKYYKYYRLENGDICVEFSSGLKGVVIDSATIMSYWLKESIEESNKNLSDEFIITIGFD